MAGACSQSPPNGCFAMLARLCCPPDLAARVAIRAARLCLGLAKDGEVVRPGRGLIAKCEC